MSLLCSCSLFQRKKNNNTERTKRRYVIYEKGQLFFSDCKTALIIFSDEARALRNSLIWLLL